MATLTYCDPLMKIKAMPRDALQAAEVLELIEDWEQKFPDVWNYESKVPTPVAIPSCQYITRFPADERWSSRDVGMTFAKMAMMKPCLKVIETEPIVRRRNLSKYEEELQSLEDHILGDREENQAKEVKNESVLAGNGVIFKHRDGVRTQSTFKFPKYTTINSKPFPKAYEGLLGPSPEAKSSKERTPPRVVKEVKKEPKVIATQVVEENTEDPESVSESEVFDDEETIKPEKPKNKKVKGSKRMRSSTTVTETDSGSEHSESDLDFSDPRTCAEYFEGLIGTYLKVSYETQICISRMKKKHDSKRKSTVTKSLKALAKKHKKAKPMSKRFKAKSRTPSGDDSMTTHASGEKPAREIKGEKLLKEIKEGVMKGRRALGVEPTVKETDEFICYLEKYNKEVLGKNKGKIANETKVKEENVSLKDNPDATPNNTPSKMVDEKDEKYDPEEALDYDPEESDDHTPYNPAEDSDTAMRYEPEVTFISGNISNLASCVSVILVSRGREALGAQPILDTQMLLFYCIPGRSKSQQGKQIFVLISISKHFSSFTIFFRANSDVNLKSGQEMTGNRGMATETYKKMFYK